MSQYRDTLEAAEHMEAAHTRRGRVVVSEELLDISTQRHNMASYGKI